MHAELRAREAAMHESAIDIQRRRFVGIDHRNVCPVVQVGLPGKQRGQVVAGVFENLNAIAPHRHPHAGMAVRPRQRAQLRMREVTLPPGAGYAGGGFRNNIGLECRPGPEVNRKAVGHLQHRPVLNACAVPREGHALRDQLGAGKGGSRALRNDEIFEVAFHPWRPKSGVGGKLGRCRGEDQGRHVVRAIADRAFPRVSQQGMPLAQCPCEAVGIGAGAEVIPVYVKVAQAQAVYDNELRVGGIVKEVHTVPHQPRVETGEVGETARGECGIRGADDAFAAGIRAAGKVRIDHVVIAVICLDHRRLAIAIGIRNRVGVFNNVGSVMEPCERAPAVGGNGHADAGDGRQAGVIRVAAVGKVVKVANAINIRIAGVDLVELGGIQAGSQRDPRRRPQQAFERRGFLVKNVVASHGASSASATHPDFVEPLRLVVDKRGGIVVNHILIVRDIVIG